MTKAYTHGRRGDHKGFVRTEEADLTQSDWNTEKHRILTEKMKPMLAGKYIEAKVINHLPVYAQPKLDGIRMLVRGKQAVTRSLKLVPNRYIQDWVRFHGDILEGMDGELMVGDPTADDVYRKTNSGVMSQAGEPDFKFHVFDFWNEDALVYKYRRELLASLPQSPRFGMKTALDKIEIVPSHLMSSIDEITSYEEACLTKGYEGIILRGPNSYYKFGRGTPTQGQLIKVKRFSDAEATIIGFEELMHNHNAATISETGYQTRSSHKENKVGGDTLGKLICVINIAGFSANTEIRIGSGFDDIMRKKIWENQSAYLGKQVKFKYFPVGVKDKPRHPIFLGFRNSIDIGD